MNKIVDCNTENIRLKVVNHSNLNLPIEIMRLFPQGIDTTQLVQWDISGETFDTGYVSLDTTVPLTGNAKTLDIFGVVQVLNSFNVALFFYIGTVIYAVNLKNPSVATADLTIGTTSLPPFNIGTGFNNTIYSIIVQSDGKILVGGEFTSYGGISANRVVRLNPNGAIDGTFVYGNAFDDEVDVIAIQSDGKIILGGFFTDYDGLPAPQIIRLNTDGSVDGSFVYGTGFNNGQVRDMVIQPDGKIVVIGNFSEYNGTLTNQIIRLNTDGSVDGTFVYGTGFDNNPRSIKRQTDGKFIIGGRFLNYNGTPADRIIRLNTDGSVDGTFVYGTGFDGGLEACAIDSAGKILAGGVFADYNGTPANQIIRLNTDGSVDGTFVYGTGFDIFGGIQCLYVYPDGTAFIGGDFSEYNGTPAFNVVKVNNNGSIDPSFVYGSGFNATVRYIVPDSNDKPYVGGSFSDYDGGTYNFIIRLNPNGSSDTTT